MHVCGFGDAKLTLYRSYQIIKSAQNSLGGGEWQYQRVLSIKNTESPLRGDGLADSVD